MRVLLATYGTRGDVEPVLALAVQLQELGATVQVCAPPDVELVAVAERSGVALTTFPKPWRSSETAPTTAEERVVDPSEFVTEHIDITFCPLLEAAEQNDVLLASGMLHFVARSVAELTGIPYRFVVFAPVLDLPQRDAVIGPPINAHRSSLGLATIDDVRSLLFTARPWVAADPTLWPVSEPSSVVRSPAWILPDDRPLPPGLEAFLDAGEPPVYVGFGSMRVCEDAAAAATTAARAHGRRTILARGWSGLSAIDDRDDCTVVGEINQQALFRRVAAVVHHGGAGTTTAAARAGAPQVVVPQAADQSYWAARVTELGIGSTHHGARRTTESLSACLDIALSPETRRRADALSDLIPVDGARTAARWLLEFAADRT
ncbi:vancomycin aglycone glucosyltransferase [Pseudonocardia endophytica]|uniref:Vancomycin aglycone glucosyltransferase n=1 Tax=Pseudonocardia endophytica TaxID=401976 RepID=A0A4R1HYU4_PSEEN|nr:glycosyltransferase [Pseudonocardia endophytica]TCK26743.1 vancomycin aglycone glucosyltransferase [Pseudonocardia endophytica]